jgi:hypothetical protein
MRSIRRGHARYFVGITVLLIHIAVYVILRGKSSLTPPERSDLFLLLMPITAAVVLAVVRSAIEERNSLDLGPPVNLFYASVVFIVTISYAVALLSTVISYPDPTIPEIENLRQSILIHEIAFGAAFGLIATDLFGKIEKLEIPKSGE